MIGDLFEENWSDKSKFFQPLGNVQRKRYIADDLELPPIKRSKGEFSGLLNQGATCYLNSLFQMVHFCPELRQFLFEIDFDATPGIEVGSQKYMILKEFQNFFARLKFLSFKNHTTTTLTDLFGWSGQDGIEQQDFAEAARAIFDTLERALLDTEHVQLFRRLFK